MDRAALAAEPASGEGLDCPAEELERIASDDAVWQAACAWSRAHGPELQTTYRAFLTAVLRAGRTSGEEQQPGQGPPIEHVPAEQVPYDVLPCDVRLPPNTTIKKGCTIPTLFAAIRQREGKDAKFPDAAPPPPPTPATEKPR
jgi:hypothetical protein